MTHERFRVSRDTPCLFITAVAKDRLPVFRTNTIKAITCEALDQARQSCKFLILSYVVMPDHLHVVADSPAQASVVLRYLKGIVAHEVIAHLKQHGYKESLQKLQHQEWKRNHRYSLWGHESNVFSIFNEAILMQKVNYIHLNPVRAGLVERAVDYRWSSARFWQGCATDNEPLVPDLRRIEWRSSAARA